jgi:hypothetical protein
MKTLNIDEVGEIIMDSPVLRPFRELKGPDDWGDQDTVGVHLKKLNYNFSEAKAEDFGRYLGKHDIGYVVGVKNWPGQVVSGEVFETLEELKQRWQID